MSHFGAFHLGIRCLPKYPFRISRSYVKSALSHGHYVDSMLAGPILCSHSGWTTRNDILLFLCKIYILYLSPK